MKDISSETRSLLIRYLIFSLLGLFLIQLTVSLAIFRETTSTERAQLEWIKANKKHYCQGQ